MKAVLEIRHTQNATTPWSRNAYDRRYATEEIRHLDSFYLWLLGLLDTRPGGRLIDISCGVGSLPRLASHLGLEAYGVDFSAVALEVALHEAPALRLAVADGERLPYADGSFDYVTHIGSLEHYVHPEAGAQEVARLLRPDGRACILLPNTFGLLGNVWTALRTGRTFDDGQPIQRYACRLEWQDLLEAAGLQVVRTVKFERAWPRTAADTRWYAKHPKAMVRLLLGPLVPLNWANYLVYVCQNRMVP
jgi:SAM-dependent methyltransferase